MHFLWPYFSLRNTEHRTKKLNAGMVEVTPSKMIREILFCIAIAPATASRTATNFSYREVHRFLLDNGHRHVAVISNHSSDAWNATYMRDIFCSRIEIGNTDLTDSKSFAVFLFDPDNDDIGLYIDVISRRKVKMSLMVVVKQRRGVDVDIFKRNTAGAEATAFYYLVMGSSGSNSTGQLSWHYIISLRSGSVMNRLTFADNSLRITEQFDLHGLEITSKSLTHAPYLTIDGCNEAGQECKENYGYLVDYMDIMAAKFNFTYTSHKDVNNDWGVQPKAGPFNASGVWGGVMGDVLRRRHDMSISIFQWTLSRSDLLQFAPVAKFRLALAVKPVPSDTDFGLFTRGFTVEAWIAIFLLSALAVFCILVTNLLDADEDRNGMKMLAFTFWIFFVVVNAYYGGVLTMFFTSPFSVPFQTEREVIRGYPAWKLLFPWDWQAYFYNFVRQGDPDYTSLWQRYEKKPEETTFHTIEDGLRRAERGQSVIFFNEQQLQGYLMSNPTRQRLRLFGHKKWEYRVVQHLRDYRVEQNLSFFTFYAIGLLSYRLWQGSRALTKLA